MNFSTGKSIQGNRINLQCKSAISSVYFKNKYFSTLKVTHGDSLLDVSDVWDSLRACACRLCVALSVKGIFFDISRPWKRWVIKLYIEANEVVV